MSRAVARLVVSAGAIAATLVSQAAWADDELGCTSDMQCSGESVCEGGKCVALNPTTEPAIVEFHEVPMRAPERPPSRWRSVDLGLFYLASPPIAGPLRSSEITQAFGIELGLRMNRELRWSFALAYQAATKDGLILSGLRAEPATLGYRFTVLSRPRWMIGVEPAVRLASIEVYDVTPSGIDVFLSSGFSLSALVAFDRRTYLRIEPIGFDIRWLFAGGSVLTDPDLGLQWRLRISLGVLLGAVKTD